MAEMVYAVHTRTCTYMLDEEGVCGWVLSPTGSQAEDRCMGAQFVACLDLREQGGLIGELRVGASGLFARREAGRFVLLKTSVIERVDYRPPNNYRQSAEMTLGAPLMPASPAVAAPPGLPAEQAPDTQRLPHRQAPAAAPYPVEPPTPSAISLDSLDLEELSTFSGQVTLQVPLYRADPAGTPRRGGPPPPPPPPPRPPWWWGGEDDGSQGR